MNNQLSWYQGDQLRKLQKAMDCLKYTTLKDTSSFHGVPEQVLIQACLDFDKDHYLVEEEKSRINADSFYEEMLPEPEPGLSREQIMLLAKEAIENFHSNCPHERMTCRCARCMKVMGSEMHYYHIDKIEDVIKRTLDDNITLDIEYNESITLFTQNILNNLYEAITSTPKK